MSLELPRVTPSGEPMTGIDSLREAVRAVPIPGAPPRLSRDGAAVGLAFLDMVLRQNYVRRLTERLTLIDHQSARCTTEVDISLSLLDDGQREAARLYQRLRRRGRTGDLGGWPADPVSTQTGDVLWVPVSKVPRRSHSPIDIISGTGAKLPRLTQYETSRLMASALYRLFKVILNTHPKARTESSSLYEFLFLADKQRWLLQAALVALLTERGKPTTPSALPASTPGTVHGEGARLRKAVLAILDDYGEDLREYVTLVNVAVNDTLLVVALDADKDEHLLSFDSPLDVVEVPDRHSLRGSLRRAGGTYWAAYHTSLPASLRAYHLVAETEPGIEINTMYLTSDADATIVTALAEDLSTVADRRESEASEPGGRSGRKLLELELQTCLRRLSDLMRRRRWEASQAMFVLEEEHELPMASKLAWAVMSGEAVERDGGELRNSLVLHPLVTADRLRQAAAEIDTQGLQYDLNLENDPARARAHVYWRRDPSRVDVDRTISVSAGMFLRDTSGSRLASVSVYVAGVSGISYILGCLLFGSLFPFIGRSATGNLFYADALIAVLLLVPGFLYARLKLPPPHSIGGQLRSLPRLVAHLTITCAALLAATIAASRNAVFIRAALAVCVLVPILSAVLTWIIARAVKDNLLLLDKRLPRWAVAGIRRMGARRTVQSQKAGWLMSFAFVRELFDRPDATFRNSSAAS